MRYPVDFISEIHWSTALKGYSRIIPQTLIDTLPLNQKTDTFKTILQTYLIEPATEIWCNPGLSDDALQKLAMYLNNNETHPEGTANYTTATSSPVTDTTLITNPLHISSLTSTSSPSKGDSSVSGVISSSISAASTTPTPVNPWYYRLCRYISCGSSSSNRLSSSSVSLSYEEKLQILFLYLKKVNQLLPVFRNLGIGLTIRPYEIHESLSIIHVTTNKDDDDDNDVRNSPSGASLRVPPSIVFVRVGKQSTKFSSFDDIPIFTVPLLRYWENIQQTHQRQREVQRQKRQQQQSQQRSQRQDSDVSTSDNELPSPLVLPPPLDLAAEDSDDNDNHHHPKGNITTTNNNNNNSNIVNNKHSNAPLSISIPQHRTPDTFSLRAPSSPLRAIHSPNYFNQSAKVSPTKYSILHFLEYFTLGTPRLRSSSGNSSDRNSSSSPNYSYAGGTNDNNNDKSNHPPLPVTISGEVLSKFSSNTTSLSLSMVEQDHAPMMIPRSSSHDSLSNHSLSYHNNIPSSQPNNNDNIIIRREPSPLSISSSNHVPRIPSLLSLETYSAEGLQSTGYPKYISNHNTSNANHSNPSGLGLPSTTTASSFLPLTTTTTGSVLQPRPGVFNHNSTPVGNNLSIPLSNIANQGNTTNPVLRIRSPLVPKVPSSNSLVGLDLRQ